jgi:hypothetical protein
LRNARAFPLLPAALASVPFGFVLVRVRLGLTDSDWSSRLHKTKLLGFIFLLGFLAVHQSS